MRIDRLNALIEKLRAEPEHYTMSTWVNTGLGLSNKKDLIELKCGTAGCIGGWLDAMANADAVNGAFTITPDLNSDHTGISRGRDLAAAYLEIDPHSREYDELYNLFMMDDVFDMEVFDQLPAEARARAGIRAVEIFRDTGRSRWRRALEDTNLIDDVERVEADYDDDYDD